MTYRLEKFERLALKIAVEDMHILRCDIYELIEYERSFNREKNARYRLMERVLAAGLKVIDLWEDRVHHMRVIDRKELEFQEKTNDLNNRINKREGLELDNEDLRNQIATLEAKLAAQTAENEKNGLKLENMRSQFRNDVDRHKKLQGRVRTAQNHSVVLKGALESGFTELEKVIQENAKEFEEARLAS